ncbi:mucin-5AC [Kryptolebias marmoratus]|uniref:mucin-5AC n=1 Tax=Kryptolebias marmoratus TaxID=37003 RepID=UPI0007F918E1|nr:mucin-5AC [Kryptolebias marmoratus]
MLLSVLLLLLVVSGTQAAFHGLVRTTVVKEIQGGGYEVLSHEKLSYSSCEESSFQIYQPANDYFIVDESSGEWCQKEYTLRENTTLFSSSAWADTGNWVQNINNITVGRRVLYYEGRNRSDIGRPNSAPQTTIIPAVRVPSNCQTDINLLNFDADGDNVECRYANGSECASCTPPSVLSVLSSCTLSFASTNVGTEGSYVVQMIMEDFPRQTITLTDSAGVQTIKTTSDFISKTPVQFVLKVVPAVPSCTKGVYLPAFQAPTPNNRAQFFAAVNQTLEIPIRAAATHSVITKLLFSGPHSVARTTSGVGNFTLTWTPSDSDDGRSHAICFIAQANVSSSVYHSDLRCLVVTVGNTPQTTVVALTTPSFIATAAPPAIIAPTTNPPPLATNPQPTNTTTTTVPPTTTPQPPTTTTAAPIAIIAPTTNPPPLATNPQPTNTTTTTAAPTTTPQPPNTTTVPPTTTPQPPNTTTVPPTTTPQPTTTTTTTTTAPLATTPEPTNITTTTVAPTTTPQPPTTTTAAPPATIVQTANPPPLATTLQPTTTTTTTAPLATTPQPTTTTTDPPTATSASVPEYIIALNAKISTTLSLEANYTTILTQLKNRLVEMGLPSTITVRILSRASVNHSGA